MDHFMSKLDSGVYLCQLAKVLQTKSEEAVRNGNTNEVRVHCRQRCLTFFKGIFLINSINAFFHDSLMTLNNEETFLQDLGEMFPWY